MKASTMTTRLLLAACAVLLLGAFTGCESTGGGGSASVGFHYGVGYYDPWYYGDYWDDPDIIVAPPPRPDPPPRPSHPIARPTPMPSIPMTPMPRGGGRR